ncbi:DUF2971 domain-containing protein [Segetibacter sp. 3557_3]|uniref:DUF2971 domain-containing protein n=1 Tax=Segetibacter sp. 3557_3 TaxID=2547429 RepID=UPI0010591244|nr:DUF2971 domain-containing protein [Segetibacter sp. 3557_3]TDH26420.1 DUF2971 domain-containing protein [Segetibacter sp. 3557_3]
MFEQHPEFDLPEENTMLWRYQDIPRYLDLLLKQKLFFNRADRFEDPFEGMITKKSKNQIYQELRRKTLAEVHHHTAAIAREEVERLATEHNAMRNSVTINSWHCNNAENYAMWNIYAKGNYGVAIQTTCKRLIEAFKSTDKSIHIGKVNYYDEKAEPIPFGNSLIPFLRKRSLYEYENEVRCCYVISDEDDEEICWEEQGIYSGVFINADLNVLIDKIYISPYSPKWIAEIIAGINEKFHINKPIVHSSVFYSVDY